MRKEAKINTQSGFTLVEVIVSLLILLATVAGIFASFITAQNFVSKAKRRIAVVNSARKQFEELRPYVRQDTWPDTLMSDNQLDDGVGGGSTVYPSGPPTVVDLGGGWTGRLNYTVTNTDNSAYRLVVVNVTWTEPD